MTDRSFDPLVRDARSFLDALAQNNTRDWFTAQKPTYDAQLKAPALLLLDTLRPELEKLTGGPVKTKLFRPHRDVRFSKDKTPYHTHLHMLWSLPEGPAFFFGIGRASLRVGAGQMGFDAARLTAWRAAQDAGDDIAGLISGLTEAGYELSEPELKRVPSPYPKDHPRAVLLRRKSCVLWQSLAPEGLVSQLRRHFTALTPLARALAAL